MLADCQRLKDVFPLGKVSYSDLPAWTETSSSRDLKKHEDYASEDEEDDEDDEDFEEYEYYEYNYEDYDDEEDDEDDEDDDSHGGSKYTYSPP